MNATVSKAFGLIIFLFMGNPLWANPCASDDDVNAGFELVATSKTLGSGLGESGLHTFDSDGDGLKEIIFGSSSTIFGANNSFLVAEYNSSSGGFDLLCQSRRYEDGIRVIAPFSNNTIATGSLIADLEGRIEVVDHVTGSKVHLIQTAFTRFDNDIKAVHTGDIDNDFSPEIVVLSEEKLAIYDANTYELEQSLDYGGEDFALGHFTSTSKIQIAINSGYVLELNGEALSTVWDYTVIAFSDEHVNAGDIDNDGLDEIIAADGWENMRVFNADNKGILWEHNADHDIDAVTVYDVTGDSVPDVVYGDGQHGEVHALNGSDGRLLWSVDNPQHGTSDVLVAEIDGDASPELLWGAGHSSTGPDYLFVHDIASDTRQWQSPEASGGGGITAVSFGHLNTDGVLDRILAAAESQRGDGILTAYDGATSAVLWQTTASTFGGSAWTGIHDIAVGDINGDGAHEVLVATDDTYDGRVYVLNALSGEVTGTVELEDGSPVYSVRIADIDGDGDVEILAGGGVAHSGASGVHTYIIDGPSLSLENTLPKLGNDQGDLWVMEAVDIDQDNTQEMLALTSTVYIIDPDNNGLLRTVPENISSLAVSTDTADNQPVVYVGDSDGVLSRMAADAGLTEVSRLCNSEIVALEAISPEKLAFVCNGALATYDVAGDFVIWATQTGFDEDLGHYDRLKVATINGKTQLLLGGSNGYLFEESETDGADNVLRIRVRALLQGPYDTEAKLMHRRLAMRGILPLQQPYAESFGHNGNETLEPALIGFSGADAPVDWVLLELRDADDPAKRVFSYAGILQRDGDVAEAQTNRTALTITDLEAGAYYVSLQHRNHLGVMSAEPVMLSATPTLIDFSNPATAVHASHTRLQRETVSLMWAGDLNQDNRLITAGPGNDSNRILNAVLTHPDNWTANSNFVMPGYAVLDLNMDGQTIHSGPDNDAQFILGNILSHPGNTRKAGNFIVRGSLP